MGYYFISIGGSGAKTLESLTHLCVAGNMPDNGKLNVLAIDPDVGNGNLERSSAALNNYDIFQKLEVGNDTPLFRTKVSLIKPFPWNPTDHDKTLDDLMGYQTYSGTPLGSLYEVLYTRKERSTGLNEGFRGHPSIGAAVLAKKYALRDKSSMQWTDFIEKVRQDIGSGNEIKIFLAGSVFGGTGAAGIPTISRLLRDSLADYGTRVSIGGALILPYFNFIAPDDETKLFARSENFLTNTKAAPKYYSQKDNVFNYMETLKSRCELKKRSRSMHDSLREFLLTIKKDKDSSQDKFNATIDNIKERFGKNSLIKGSNLLKDSTAIERNKKTGGHYS